MSNLFMSFDPYTLNIPVNWVMMMVMLTIPANFWLAKSQAMSSVHKMFIMLSEEFSVVFSSKNAPGITWVISSVIISLLLMNLFGLLPYVFPLTSHLVVAFSLAFPLWVGYMVFSWFKQPTFMLAHLVPMSTPMLLMPFMVIIELISSLIRSFTLSVRLVANIVAGHLLLTLLSNNMSGAVVISFVYISLLLLSILESAVALIQSYVFSLLSALYLEEVNSMELVK